MESLYMFAHGALLWWLGFHLLAAFSIMLPLYIDGIIPREAWTAVYAPLWAVFGAVVLFVAGDVWATLRRMNRRVLGYALAHAHTGGREPGRFGFLVRD